MCSVATSAHSSQDLRGQSLKATTLATCQKPSACPCSPRQQAKVSDFTGQSSGQFIFGTLGRVRASLPVRLIGRDKRRKRWKGRAPWARRCTNPSFQPYSAVSPSFFSLPPHFSTLAAFSASNQPHQASKSDDGAVFLTVFHRFCKVTLIVPHFVLVSAPMPHRASLPHIYSSDRIWGPDSVSYSHQVSRLVVSQHRNNSIPLLQCIKSELHQFLNWTLVLY